MTPQRRLLLIRGGWGGVFDAPAAPSRGVEDSAPATPVLFRFR